MIACCEASEKFGIYHGDLDGIEDETLEEPHAEGVTTDMDCEKYKKCCCNDNGEGGVPFNPDDPVLPEPEVLGYSDGWWIFAPPKSDDEDEDDDDDGGSGGGGGGGGGDGGGGGGGTIGGVGPIIIGDGGKEEEEDPAIKRCREEGWISAWDDEGQWGCYEPDGLTQPSNITMQDDPCKDAGGKNLWDAEGEYIGCYNPDPGEDEDEGPIEEEEERPCKRPRPDGSCDCYVGDPECDSDHEDYIQDGEEPEIYSNYFEVEKPKPGTGPGTEEPGTEEPGTEPKPGTEGPGAEPIPGAIPGVRGTPPDPEEKKRPDRVRGGDCTEDAGGQICEEVAYKINLYRSSKQLSWLIWDHRLAQAAQFLANDLHSRGQYVVSHTDSTYGSTEARVLAFNISGNIVENVSGAGKQGAKEVVDQWKSEVLQQGTHHWNMLKPELKSVGIGCNCHHIVFLASDQDANTPPEDAREPLHEHEIYQRVNDLRRENDRNEIPQPSANDFQDTRIDEVANILATHNYIQDKVSDDDWQFYGPNADVERMQSKIPFADPGASFTVPFRWKKGKHAGEVWSELMEDPDIKARLLHPFLDKLAVVKKGEHVVIAATDITKIDPPTALIQRMRQEYEEDPKAFCEKYNCADPDGGTPDNNYGVPYVVCPPKGGRVYSWF